MGKLAVSATSAVSAGQARAGLRAWVATHPVAVYVVLAYALSWGYWIPMALDHHGIVDVPWESHFPGLMGPMIAAFITTGLAAGRDGLGDLVGRMGRWKVGWGWFLLAAAFPLVLFVAALPLAAAFGPGLPSLTELGEFSGLPSVGALGIWLLLVVVNGFGEETGWRGMAQDRLQRRFRPLEATGLVAVIWATWHLPLFFFHDNFLEMSPLMVVGWLVGLFVGGAVVLAWLYNGTTQSILMVALWHGSYNWAVATEGAEGLSAAAVSAVVIFCGVVILLAEIRARRRDPSDSVILGRVPNSVTRAVRELRG
jgi:CAAX protease family protein